MKPFGKLAVDEWIGAAIVGFLPLMSRTAWTVLTQPEHDAAAKLIEDQHLNGELFFAMLTTAGTSLLVHYKSNHDRGARRGFSLSMGYFASLLCLGFSILGYAASTQTVPPEQIRVWALSGVFIALTASLVLETSLANQRMHAMARESRTGNG